MTTLYLVRHGLTEANDAQLLQGVSPGRLNSAGIAQVEALAATLRGQRFDAIVASDLQRAIDSARIIAQGRHLDIDTTPLLRERDWGDFTGRYIPDLKGLPLPANIEQLTALTSRAARFIAWLLERYPGQTVLAVGHGIINKAIQAVHYGKPMQELRKMDNAEYRILHLTDTPTATPQPPDEYLNLK